MFRQEIKNAETIKKSCWLTYFYRIVYVNKKTYEKENKNYCNYLINIICCKKYLINPEELNQFIQDLTDPFRETDVIKHRQSTFNDTFVQEWIPKSNNMSFLPNSDNYIV